MSRPGGRAPRGLLAAAVLVGGGLLAACGDDLGPGTVLEARPDAELTGAESSVQLPHGRVTFVTTEAGPLPDDAVSEEADGAEDASFVGVAWTFTPGEGVPGDLGGFLLADGVAAEVALVVDGERHDLGPAYSVPGGEAGATRWFVSVDDATDPADLELEVEMDGVAQRVRADGSGREAGRAAGLYELPDEPTTPPCSARVEPASRGTRPTCTVAVLDLPWVTGLGWAEDGTTWTVVDTTTGAGRLEVRTQQDASVLDGAEPASVLLEDVRGAELRTQLVWSTSDGDPRRLEVARVVRTEAGAVELRADVDLG